MLSSGAREYCQSNLLVFAFSVASACRRADEYVKDEEASLHRALAIGRESMAQGRSLCCIHPI
jgi:hypothetical protein